jgi:hypothetical protein
VIASFKQYEAARLQAEIAKAALAPQLFLKIFRADDTGRTWVLRNAGGPATNVVVDSFTQVSLRSRTGWKHFLCASHYCLAEAEVTHINSEDQQTLVVLRPPLAHLELDSRGDGHLVAKILKKSSERYTRLEYTTVLRVNYEDAFERNQTVYFRIMDGASTRLSQIVGQTIERVLEYSKYSAHLEQAKFGDALKRLNYNWSNEREILIIRDLVDAADKRGQELPLLPPKNISSWGQLKLK